MSNGQCLCTFSRESRIANAYMPNGQLSHAHMPNYLKLILRSKNSVNDVAYFVRTKRFKWFSNNQCCLYFVTLLVFNPNRFVEYKYLSKWKEKRSRSTITWGKIKKRWKKKIGCKRTRCNCVRDTVPRHASYFRTFHPYRITGTQWRKNRTERGVTKAKPQ